MKSRIIREENHGWIYLFNSEAQENKEKIANELKKPNHGSLGKYLFFSDNKQALIDLAEKILIKYSLYNAKVPLTNNPQPSSGFGFVLCVYDSESTLKKELKQYADSKTIHYRYWKSDEKTLKGEYSTEFLQTKRFHTRNRFKRGQNVK